MSTDSGSGLGGRAAKAIAWVMLEKWSVRLISLGVFAVLTRFVTASDFGLISIATVFTAVLTVIADGGFGKALVQKARLDPADAATAFWTSFAISVALYFVLFVSAPFIAALFGMPQLGPVLRVLGLILILGGLSSVPAALLERDFEFRLLTLRQLSGAIVGGLITVPLAFAGFGVWALVSNSLLTTLGASIALWVTSRWRPTFTFSVGALRSLVGVGGGALGVELLNAVQANIDKLLIGIFLGDVELGYYFVGQRAVNILAEVLTSFVGRISLTSFSKSQDDPVRLNRMLRRLTLVVSILAVSVFGTAALVAPQLVPFVFGPGWGRSVLIFQLLAPAAALTAITAFDGSLLLAVRKPVSAFGLALAQNVLGVLLILLALPFGIAGVAVSRSVRVVAMMPVRIVVLRLKAALDVRPYLVQLLTSVVAFVPVIVIVGPLQLTSWATADHAFLAFAVPVSVISAAIYLVTLWFISSKDNRAFLSTYTRKTLAVLRIHRGRA